jgi:hypothetical protein
MLEKAGNLFAKSEMKSLVASGAFFPPSTLLEIKEDEVVLSNQQVGIVFKLKDTGHVTYTLPDQRIVDRLKAEKATTKTHEIDIEVYVTYFASLAQSKDRDL